MGKVIPFKVTGDLRTKLLEAVGGDTALKTAIAKMSDNQVVTAFDNTKGSLLSLTEEMEALDKEFAEYIASTISKRDNTLIINAAINYVVDICAQIPKDVEHADAFDNAYKKLYMTEMRRMIEKAVRSVL